MPDPAEVDVLARPRAIHSERLEQHTATLARLEQRDTWFSRARVSCFVAFLVLVMLGWWLSLSWMWLGLPLLSFLVLVVLHERVINERDVARRAVDHHRDALERLAGRWAGRGATANDYCEPEHPYAADLDLFGVGSLFDLMCRARTRAGEEQLAAWLTCHARARVTPEQIVARQRSVAALIEAVELREQLAVRGATARVEVRPAALRDWGRAPTSLSERTRARLRIAGVVLPTLVILGGVIWGLGEVAGAYLLVGAGLVGGAIQRSLSDTIARIAGPVDRFSHELSVLTAVLAVLERERFEDPRLLALQQSLREGDVSSSDAVAQLRSLAGWYEAQRNGLFAPIAMLLMWGPNFALAIERWRVRFGPHIATWIASLAELEALASIAGFAFEHPDYVVPQIEAETADGPVLDGEALGHPLLGPECVPNDLHLSMRRRPAQSPGPSHADLVAPVRAYVISGSNMSGKSTFLRTVGCNVVLALLGAPVRARALRLTPVQIGATLRVQDSLHEGASRFWAELTRLRTITEQAAAGPTLFLLDEIFHGTNSHDRRIGAEALLRSLIAHDAIGLLTTHDLALAEAAEALAPAAVNVHFQDELRDGELVFDYRMREGVVRRSNALELMRSVGLDV